MGWQWHQLDHMQIICTLYQADNHVSTSSLSLLQAGCSSWCTVNSVKMLKAMQLSDSWWKGHHSLYVCSQACSDVVQCWQMRQVILCVVFFLGYFIVCESDIHNAAERLAVFTAAVCLGWWQTECNRVERNAMLWCRHWWSVLASVSVTV